MVQLSKRMKLLASKVTEENRLADIGTDHGYIPIALVLEKKIPSAIAMDVNKGPLARARQHIEEQGLENDIQTRLSDGLEKLCPQEADTVLIAGMGGALTVHILEGGVHCLDSVQELILQPQSEIYLVREYLCQHDFVIIEEDIVLDEGKYYPMIKAVHGQASELTAAEYAYGQKSVQASLEVWKTFLKLEFEKNEKIIETLLKNGQRDTVRMQEKLEKRELICSIWK